MFVCVPVSWNVSAPLPSVSPHRKLQGDQSLFSTVAFTAAVDQINLLSAQIIQIKSFTSGITSFWLLMKKSPYPISTLMW